MVLHIRSDGSNEDALAQAVAQHRAAFFAGVQADFADTSPQEAGSACSELLADEHAPTPRERARQIRHLGAICIVTFVAIVCFALPLAAHFTAKAQAPERRQVPTLGVTG